MAGKSPFLFDMDGLLIDSEPLWTEITDLFCIRRGQRYTPDDEARCMGRGIGETVRYLAETYGWPLDRDAHIREIVDEFIAHVPKTPEMAGATQLLTGAAAERPIALGTSSERRIVDAALGDRGWLHLFGAVVTGSDVPRLKPWPDIYSAAAERLGVSADTCFVFEDSLTGCQAGRSAGAYVIAVPAAGKKELFFAAANFVANTLEEGFAHAQALASEREK